MKESVIRTLVPIIYALLMKTGAAEWLGLESEVAQNVAALLGAGVVYAVVRWAESHRAAFGWLLGYASAPSYGDTKNGSAE